MRHMFNVWRIVYVDEEGEWKMIKVGDKIKVKVDWFKHPYTKGSIHEVKEVSTWINGKDCYRVNDTNFTLSIDEVVLVK